jgi:hypothetical protein
MAAKPTLYDMLGVPTTADDAAIDAAYRERSQALLNTARGAADENYASRLQALHVAVSTLKDPSSRLAYDAKLRASAAPAPSHRALELMPMEAKTAARDNVHLRAEALSLRADALALRADAMLLQTTGSTSSRAETVLQDRDSVWRTLMDSRPLWRIIMFLLFMGMMAFGLSRCVSQGRLSAAAGDKASEQAALQEYYQTHGVRPANMAELELLEAERRRRENQARMETQDEREKERAKKEAEDKRRRESAEAMGQLQEAQRTQAMEAERARQAEERRVADDKARKEEAQLAEQQRAERQRQEWQQIIKR